MNLPDKYIELIKNKSIFFNCEIGLEASDALYAINLLKASSIPISGGDIITKNNSGAFVYAIHNWGEKYIYLNFYCNRRTSESEASYAKRTYEIAEEHILMAKDVAENLGKECYIVLIL